MKEINATFKKRKQNLLRQRKKNVQSEMESLFVVVSLMKLTRAAVKRRNLATDLKCSLQFRSVGPPLS